MNLNRLEDLVGREGAYYKASYFAQENSRAFEGRVPNDLIDFWVSRGFGTIRRGYFTICDPRPFDDILKIFFRGESEFIAADMSVVGYTGDGELLFIWHRDGRKVIITLDQSIINVSSIKMDIDAQTGYRKTENEIIDVFLSQFETFDAEFFEEACMLHGNPALGEIFGFVPALQLGGSALAKNMRRVKAEEHIMFLAQLERLKLMEMTSPEPNFPIGRDRFVRHIGTRV